MVKAGAGTDAVIDELVPLLDEDDIVVDAGNAHIDGHLAPSSGRWRRRTCTSSAWASPAARRARCNGPSIMPGGSEHAWERLGPVLESIAAEVDGEPCCTHVGPDAAGHFVKMVHNGIEYADMQLIAESYDLLRTCWASRRPRSRRSSASGTTATSSRS